MNQEPSLTLVKMKILSKSVKETIEIGRRLGKALRHGDVVALVGPLGSGKTTITRGIVKGLDAKENANVNSPTFVIVREYDGKIPVFHIDLYRVDKEENLESFGFRDYLGRDGVTIIEWADKFKEYLPKEHILIRLSAKDFKKRQIDIVTKEKRLKRLIHENLGC